MLDTLQRGYKQAKLRLSGKTELTEENLIAAAVGIGTQSGASVEV